MDDLEPYYEDQQYAEMYEDPGYTFDGISDEGEFTDDISEYMHSLFLLLVHTERYFK